MMLLQLLVVSLLINGAVSTDMLRRVVDLVFNRSVMKHHRDEMLPIFAEKLPIQMHTTSETDCEEIIKMVERHGDDDFIVLIGIQQTVCPQRICKKNFAYIQLASNQNHSVAYGCDSEQFTIDWKTISENIYQKQEKNMFHEIPNEYQKDTSFLTENRGVVAGIAVMGLIIAGLVLLLILTSLKHSKELKALKKGVSVLDDSKKKNDENMYTGGDSTK